MPSAIAGCTGRIRHQTVHLPTNLIAATLSFAYETISTDPNGDDSLTVYITATNETPLINLGTTSSASPTGGWVPVNTNFISYAGGGALSSYAGKAINVYFYVTTDLTYGNLTEFNIDSVSLIAATTADIAANDDFANAILIPPAGITNDVITTYAAKESGEPNIGNNAGGHSLWWTWTSPGLGNVIISTPGSSFNTLLGVYTGSSVSTLTSVTNSDGINRPSGLAYLTFPVSAGTQYYIGLDGQNGQSGAAVFSFRFTQDTKPPVVKITSPASGSSVNGPTVFVKGTASDNVAVASVYFQLVNAQGTNAWQLAAGTNSWSAIVTNLIPGPNTVRVEAYDTSTNLSKVVACVLNYLVPTPLNLTIVGRGAVSGAANGKLLNVGYPYTLTAVAAAGFRFTGWSGDISTNSASLRFTMTPNLAATANFVDVQKPVLSITAPVAHERWSNSVFTVTGKASDNGGVASVWLQVNNGAWMSDANSNNGWTNWNAVVTLVPGTNTIRAYAVDGAGNVSPTNTVSSIYVLSAPLTVEITGSGTVKPNYNNVLLEISNSYSMTATAASGYVFSNWTATTGAVITNGPILKFTMVSNLDFIANFVPNPYTAAAGTYEGLFYDANDVAPAGSGFFTAQVTGTGSFTASFQQGSKRAVSGQFSLTGEWSTNALKTWGNTAISLQLDLTGGNVVTGGLTNAGWTAGLTAYRAVFSKNNLAPQAGKYTLVFPGTNSDTQPGGNGFGSVIVTTTGSVTLSGTLGDATKVTSSAIESSQGMWPLYVSLDSGNGMLIGWLTFANEADRDIDGLLWWFRPALPAAPAYKLGFTNEIEAVGSAYNFSSVQRVLNLTDGYVLATDGGLAQSISNQFTLAPNNIVTGSDKLKLTFTTSTGLFQGSVTNAAGKPVSVSGAVLQKQTNGFGQFVNGTQTGSVYVAPQ